MLKEAEARLAEAVTGAAVALLDSAPADFWPRAQRLHHTAVAAADEVLRAVSSDLRELPGAFAGSAARITMQCTSSHGSCCKSQQRNSEQ